MLRILCHRTNFRTLRNGLTKNLVNYTIPTRQFLNPHIIAMKEPKQTVNVPLFVAGQVSNTYCRTGLVTDTGKITKITVEPLKLYRDGKFIESSSQNIWNSLVICIKKLLENVSLTSIKGIGLTAIPALVCIDEKGGPVTASLSRDPNRNVILHNDMRSIVEVEKINQIRHSKLQYFGEKVFYDSIQESKIMWLKTNLKAVSYDRATSVNFHFDGIDADRDLDDCPDHETQIPLKLTFKNNPLFRSYTTLLTNWSYESTINGKDGWNSDFFNAIDLNELAENKWSKIGSIVLRPGTPAGNGVSEIAAKETGILSGLPVATTMSDQYAGALGLVGCQAADDGADDDDDGGGGGGGGESSRGNVVRDIKKRLYIVLDSTSTSHIVFSKEPVFIKAIHGPFQDAILPSMWLNKANQTSSENLIQHVIERDSATTTLRKRLGKTSITDYLNKMIKMKNKQHELRLKTLLTKDIHILPDFNGNKSPFSDPLIKGMITGLTFSRNLDELAKIYLAAMQSLAYNTKHIISTLRSHGYEIQSMVIGGGQNFIFSILHKDICGLPIVRAYEQKAKLIGTGILVAVASNHYKNFNEAINAMGNHGKVFYPETNADYIDFHERKYRVFLQLYKNQLEYRSIMSNCKLKNELDCDSV